MSEQLTQAEIDALRNAVRAGNVASAAEVKLPEPASDVKVITYDFRKPKLLSAERMVKLQLVHQTLLKNLQSMLFSMFKIAGDSTLNALEQVSYGEFLLSLAAPTYLLSLDVEPDVGLMGVEMSPPMGQILLDMLLGGNGNEVYSFLNVYFTGGDTFDRIKIYQKTGGGGYESDNHTVGFWTETGGVPEPATWAMLIAGFGLVGMAARRRRHAGVTA